MGIIYLHIQFVAFRGSGLEGDMTDMGGNLKEVWVGISNSSLKTF